MSIALAHTILLAIHVLAAAALFGAMIFSFFVLHPRARAYFSKAAEFEEFIRVIAAGGRWIVLTGYAIIGITGIATMLLKSNDTPGWLTLMMIKGGLFLLALTVFIMTSWHFWPERLMALPGEIPKHQRRFRLVGITLMLIVAACFLLGGIAKHWLCR